MEKKFGGIFNISEPFTAEVGGLRKSLEYAEKDVEKAALFIMELHKIAAGLFKEGNPDEQRKIGALINTQVDGLCNSLRLNFSNDENSGVLNLIRDGKIIVSWNEAGE
jgi:hypothetical protein